MEKESCPFIPLAVLSFRARFGSDCNYPGAIRARVAEIFSQERIFFRP